MGNLVISRRKGESVQLYVKGGSKATFELVELFSDVALFKVKVGLLSNMIEAPYNSIQKLMGGTLHITKHYWKGDLCEQVKMIFDLPREVSVSRTEWLERKGLRIEEMLR